MQQAAERKAGRGPRFLGRVGARWRLISYGLGQFFYGMTAYEMVRELERERARHEQLLAFAALGSALGLPLPSSYYGLRLLPYELPRLRGWRRTLWCERDLTDLVEQEFG